ncbi:hypothetical protein VULLAG_LOCUS10920 [Vulpes lagopus]
MGLTRRSKGHGFAEPPQEMSLSQRREESGPHQGICLSEAGASLQGVWPLAFGHRAQLGLPRRGEACVRGPGNKSSWSSGRDSAKLGAGLEGFQEEACTCVCQEASESLENLGGSGYSHEPGWSQGCRLFQEADF